MTALVPVLFAILGAGIYGFTNQATNPKTAELGRLVFFAAFLAIMLYTASHSVTWPPTK